MGVRTPARWTELPRGLELHPERRRNGKRHRSTRDVAGGVRRQIRAVAERLAHEDAGELLVLLGIEEELRRAWVVAVAGVREHASTNGGRP